MRVWVLAVLVVMLFPGCAYYLGDRQSRFDLEFNPPNKWITTKNTKTITQFTPLKWDTTKGPIPTISVEIVPSDDPIDTFMRKEKQNKIAKLRDYQMLRGYDRTIIVPEREGLSIYEYTNDDGVRMRVYRRYYYGYDGIVIFTIQASRKFWLLNQTMLNEVTKSLRFKGLPEE